jgi:hypothetical protein
MFSSRPPPLGSGWLRLQRVVTIAKLMLSTRHRSSAPKGHNVIAQGNALGLQRPYETQALKGRNAPRPTYPPISTRRAPCVASFRPFRACDSYLVPNPGRCPGLSPVTPLGLKTTSEVAVRIRPYVTKRRQTVGVFLATPTAWQRVATIAAGGYDREVDCFQRGIGLPPQRGIM